jgi:DNA anti-recombination protein RmuC
VQLTEYRALAKPFKDFIDRTNALRTQLETVLDTVRTYLGIRQQRQSTETLERIEKLGELQAKMLNVIGKHEELLKRLTWWLLAFTIGLLILEIATAMHLLP